MKIIVKIVDISSVRVYNRDITINKLRRHKLMKTQSNGIEINKNILGFAHHLVPISDFSRGKTAQLFDDVKNNNAEYIVLKNNQPTAMVISLEMYTELVEKASKMEQLLDKIEEERLLALAEKRMTDTDSFIDHDDLCRKMGFDPDAIEAGCESVEIE